VVEVWEVCDDGNATAGDGCSPDCVSIEMCGNGIVDGILGEACDDGNLDSGDGCSYYCLLESCGNGVLELFELCDDGNNAAGDGCSANCRSEEICGDGVVDQAAGEACDDGNLAAGDGCSASCQIESCGNGVVDDGELCDVAALRQDAVCRPDCFWSDTCFYDELTDFWQANCAGEPWLEPASGCAPTCVSTGACGNGRVDLFRGEQCDDGNTSAGDGCSPDCQQENCGNAELDPGEICDDGNLTSGDGCARTCVSDESCGNGVPDTAVGEACDDGNVVGGDGCSATCALESCGNGVVDAGEACDDGTLGRSTVTCSANCLSNRQCGNSFVDLDYFEACDDGNTQSGDGCSAICELETCGNGVLDAGEVCDDGDLDNGDGCDSLCISDESCGNGLVDLGRGETCDDGNDTNGDGCSYFCQIETCGDGIVDPGEVCDDSNRVGGDGCAASCFSDETCPNGIVDIDAGESCDDWNLSPGDGCSPTCRIEGCGNGQIDFLEACDDGNLMDGDGCAATCLSNEACGNSFVDGRVGEECDDGNADAGDGCSSQCRFEYCGNGAVDSGEVCDDNNAISGDGCSSDCKSTEFCGNSIVDSAIGEQCDEGDTTAGDGCSAACRLEYCGNLAIDPGEACDDGNNDSDDGCSADCNSDETCPNGYTDVGNGEQCDDGNSDADDGCDASCKLESCGDGALDIHELCDDGNNQSGDGCSGDCLSLETCGNSYVDAIKTERCDDGNQVSGDGCAADCSSDESCGNGLLDSSQGEICDDGDAQSNGDESCVADCSAMQLCGDGVVNGTEACDDGAALNGNYTRCSGDCLTAATGLIALGGVVASGFLGANSLASADLDNDGDVDFIVGALQADTVAWFENTAGDGSSFTRHDITTAAIGVRSVAVGDVDGDGAVDVLCAVGGENEITWWQNNLPSGGAFIETVVSINAIGARAVAAADLDGDGDLDLVSGSYNDNKVAWYQNQTGDGQSWIEISISAGVAVGPSDLVVVDISGEGVPDVLVSAEAGHAVYSFINPMGPGMPWLATKVGANISLARTLAVADIDGDGDQDAAVGAGGSKVHWLYNPSVMSLRWPRTLVSTNQLHPRGLALTDLDLDGDADLVTASSGDDTLAWYENRVSGGKTWLAHLLGADLDGAAQVIAVDVDGDDDDDLVVSAQLDDNVRWYRNFLREATCGDGTVQPYETCDGQPGQTGEGVCVALCRAIQTCGNGVTRGSEACDDGNLTDGDYCNSTCQAVTGSCGDNSQQSNEECDDGNTEDGDGCSAVCAREPLDVKEVSGLVGRGVGPSDPRDTLVFSVPTQATQVVMTLKLIGDLNGGSEYAEVYFNSSPLGTAAGSNFNDNTLSIASGVPSWSERSISSGLWGAGGTVTIEFATTTNVNAQHPETGMAYRYQVTLDYGF